MVLDEMDAQSRRAVECWSNQRGQLIAKRVQEEVEDRLEEANLSLRPSRPFLRLVVSTTVAAVECIEEEAEHEMATLTIWDPTARHLEVACEGAYLRLSNVSVRDARYHGRIQLSLGRNGSCEAMGSPSQHNQSPTQSLVGLSLLLRRRESERREDDTEGCDEPDPIVDVVGIVFRIVRPEEESSPTCLILTDESGHTLRIRCREALVNASNFPRTGLDVECPSVVCVRRLRACSFDAATCSAVAESTWCTTIQNEPSRRSRKLAAWASKPEGKERLAAMCRYDSTGLLLHSMSDYRDLLGYIHDFSVRAGYRIVASVDCGIGEYVYVILSGEAILRLLQVCNGFEAMHEDDEERCKRLLGLGPLVRGKRTLYRIRVVSTPLGNEVVSLVQADVENIAKLTAHLYAEQTK